MSKAITGTTNEYTAIYCELELNLRIKSKKCIKRDKPEPLTVPEGINHVWSMDFMHDQLKNGRSVRLFNIIDDFNREGLGMEIDFSLPSERVIHALNQIIEWRGCPEEIRCDNGRSTSVPHFSVGQGKTTSRCDISIQANRNKTAMLNAITARSAMTG